MQHKCEQCGSEFESQRSDARFCRSTCRHKYWLAHNSVKHQEYNTVEEVKEALEFSQSEFEVIQRHFKRVMELYEDFEDKIVYLEKRLYEIENDIESDTTKELQEKISQLEYRCAELDKELKQKGSKTVSDILFDLEDN